MHVVNIQRIARRGYKVGIARNEPVARGMREVRSLQYPNPFRVADHKIAQRIAWNDGRHRPSISVVIWVGGVAADNWCQTVHVVASVSIDIVIKAKFIGAGQLVGDED